MQNLTNDDSFWMIKNCRPLITGIFYTIYTEVCFIVHISGFSEYYIIYIKDIQILDIRNNWTGLIS